MKSIDVLVVDDDPLWTMAVVDYLRGDGLNCATAASRLAARPLLAAGPRLLILDQNLPDGPGLDLVEAPGMEGRSLCRVLVVTGHPRVEDAVQALRLGIDDYLTKPVSLEVLRHAVLRSLESLRLEKLASLEKWRDSQQRDGSAMVGAGLAGLLEEVAQIAPSAAPVLLTGETGSGKSLVARAIHDASGRSGPYVKVNCAALPSQLVEAELFGVERGAYTGATATRPGLFELADQGTLLLDEIGELELSSQAKLLSVLDDGEARRVGGSRPIRFKARIVAATNRDLWAEVAAKTFRADLLYRLEILKLELPPLRERPGDIAELCAYHLGRLGDRHRLADGELERLVAYGWPGNTRELFAVLERAALLQSSPLRPSAFLHGAAGPPAATAAGGKRDSPREKRAISLSQAEQSHILEVLSSCGGRRAQAAALLGIGSATLQRRLREYRDAGIEVPGIGLRAGEAPDFAAGDLG
jgi:DNA-binding NtrC family response regulator